jgi:iron complex outermembrane receptor protein
MKKTALQLVLLLFVCVQVMAQTRTVTGTVSDRSDGTPLPGVNIVAKNTGTGTATDSGGQFSLQVPTSVTTLVVSSIGFLTQEVAIPESNVVVITLEASSSELEEVVVTVGRGSQRTITDTPLPVDVLSAKDLTSTGQLTFDKALQYRVPSFNTVQTPVNDATSLLDPYELRNMGPSRTLILINGKRKNASALIYTQTSPGRGETGVDISAIPQDAIKRVEILRDGASAQYGSDAIAGVMNIILKDDIDQGSVTLRTGITGEGDGEMLGLSINNGAKLLGTGFINYTADFSKVSLANRPGKVDGGTDPSQLGPENRPLAGGEYADFVYVDPDNADNYEGGVITAPERDAILAGNAAGIQSINDFLAKKPDAGNINGSPETTAAKFLVNGSLGINEYSNVYFNAAYIYKKVNSFANYRTPYWRPLADAPYMADFFGDGTPESYVGYVPTFDGDLNDYNATLGFKSTKDGWNTDLSLTVGGNRQTYTVRNSHNRNTSDARNPDTYLGDMNGNGQVDLTPYDANGDGTTDDNEGVELLQGDLKYRENSPVTFRAGGTQFNHIVGNIDIMKSLSKIVTLSFGSEFRSETFQIIEGDLASYEAGGADSFAGNSKENSFSSNRYNIGGYVTFGFDFTEDFLIDATGRFENYSDFGDAFVYKLSTRYKFLEDKITLRGSLSTGFRAPSLHQIYTQKAQYSFVAGQGIQVSGLVNNVSREANLMNLDKLDAEKSSNITLGLGVKPIDNLSFTVDYYNIKVDDRIVLSNELDPSDVVPDLVAVSFFSNAIDTETAGFDVVGSYTNIALGQGMLRLNLAANIQLKNEIVGDIRNPEFAESTGQEVIDETQKALLFTSRPKYKGILGVDYTLGKFIFSLNNTLFGPTNFRNAGMDEGLEIEFVPKIVTDLGITYQLNRKTTLALNVNNLLDVLPEWKFKAVTPEGETILADKNATQAQSNLITFNQRYPIVTYDGSHFSQLGTMINFAVNIQF